MAVTVVPPPNGETGEGSIELIGSRDAGVVEVSALTLELRYAAARGVARAAEITDAMSIIKQMRLRTNGTEYRDARLERSDFMRSPIFLSVRVTNSDDWIGSTAKQRVLSPRFRDIGGG